MLTTSLTLLARLQQPDQPGAWRDFVHLYTPLLLAWADRQGLRGADAEDLTQQVLLKLLRLLPDYRRGEGQSFRRWLFTVTRTQCIDFRRRKATRALPPADGLSGADGVPELGPAADMDEREYRLRLIRSGLDVIRGDFEPATIAAFTRVVIDGGPVKEVARELGLSLGAVYNARNRVLTRLREYLDEFLD
jgi:RNA polymerase sigma-70 factor (ECF subfamily)